MVITLLCCLKEGTIASLEVFSSINKSSNCLTIDGINVVKYFLKIKKNGLTINGNA